MFFFKFVIQRKILTSTLYRYLGGDENGWVANYVETEQIVEFNGMVASFVQTRGSIPLLWRQV